MTTTAPDDAREITGVLVTEAPAIYGALVDIQSEMGRFQKTGKGPATQGSYPFVPVDDIVAKLNELLTAHRVAVIPRQVSCEQQLFRFPKVTPSGAPVFDGRPDAVQLITKLHYEFHFVSALDGSREIAEAYGESIDTGDKGIRRAATAAYKEVLLRTFSIVSGTDDPDALDPNEQPAAIVRKSRGEQQRDAAATPTGRRRRGAAAEDAQTPAAEESPAKAEHEGSEIVDVEVEPTAESAAPEPAGGTNNEDPDNVEPQPEPAPRARRQRRNAAPAPEAAAELVREEQTPNEQRSEDWKPDAADVAHAEATAPAAREVTRPVAKAEPVTKADEKAESVADLRAAIRTALEARGHDRGMANELGDELTGKPRGQWFANQNDLKLVIKAIEAGQVPASYGAADEPGF